VALAAVPWFEQVQSGQWSGRLQYRREAGKGAWTGDLQLSAAQLAVPQLADPLQLAAHAEIDGARVVLDHVKAQAGKVLFTGDYRYEPGAPRPHHVHLRADEVDAADLEAELMPALRRTPSLLARAFGRATVPEWLRRTEADGTVQIDDLSLAGSHLQKVRARLIWDATHVELDGLQAALDKAPLSGRLIANLRGTRPAYRLTGTLKGMPWQSGKVDAEGALETSGIGVQLLSNLKSEGAFTAANVDFGAVMLCRTVSGNYALTWPQATPRLRLTGLNLRTADETFTGSGGTQDDGRLLVLLTNGTKEMRMIGPLAKVKVE
jgi:hypothetical protein